MGREGEEIERGRKGEGGREMGQTYQVLMRGDLLVLLAVSVQCCLRLATATFRTQAVG